MIVNGVSRDYGTAAVILTSTLGAGLFDTGAVEAKTFALADLPAAMAAAQQTSSFECVVRAYQHIIRLS